MFIIINFAWSTSVEKIDAPFDCESRAGVMEFLLFLKPVRDHSSFDSWRISALGFMEISQFTIFFFVCVCAWNSAASCTCLTMRKKNLPDGLKRNALLWTFRYRSYRLSIWLARWLILLFQRINPEQRLWHLRIRHRLTSPQLYQCWKKSFFHSLKLEQYALCNNWFSI